MSRSLLVASLIVVSSGFSWGSYVPQTSDDAAAEEKVLALVKKFSGEIVRDENAPGKPIVRMHLSTWSLSGEKKKLTGEAIRDLRGLKSLSELDLRFAELTDEAWKELSTLQNLTTLYLLRRCRARASRRWPR